MDRSEALAYLGKRYKTILAEVDIAVYDDDTLGIAVDNALRELGTAETDLATANITSNVRNYIALLEYFCLDLVASELANRTDLALAGGEVDKKRSQAFSQVTKLLGLAEERCKQLGYLAQETQSFYLNLDFQAPNGGEY